MQQYKQFTADDVTDTPPIFAKATLQGRRDIPRRRSVTTTEKHIAYQVDTEDHVQVEVKHTQQQHSLLPFIGLGMLIVLLSILLITFVITPFCTWLFVHWNYGSKPVATLDMPSHHLLAEVVNNRIVVYDFVPDNPDTTKVLLAHNASSSSVPVLEVHDTNNDGKLDIIVTTQNSPMATIFLGKGDTFVSEQEGKGK